MIERSRQEAEESVSRRFLGTTWRQRLEEDEARMQALVDERGQQLEALQRELEEAGLIGDRATTLLSRYSSLHHDAPLDSRASLSVRPSSIPDLVHIPDRQQEDAFEDEPTYTDAEEAEDLAELSRTAREVIEETASMPMSRGADGPRLGKSARAREVAKVIYRLLLTKEMETLQEQVDNEVINEMTFKERADAIMHKYNRVRVDANLIVHHGGPEVRIEWEPPASEISEAD